MCEYCRYSYKVGTICICYLKDIEIIDVDDCEEFKDSDDLD